MTTLESAGNKATEQKLNAVFDNIVKAAANLFRIQYFGVKNLKINTIDFYIYLFPGLFFLYALALSGKHLTIFQSWMSNPLYDRLVEKLLTINPNYHFGFLCFLAASIVFFALGIGPYRAQRRYQRAIDCMALKNGLGTSPLLVNTRQDGPHKLKLRILSEGVGVDRYETKRADLEAAFGAVIERIRTAETPRFVEISLASRRIPHSCTFLELIQRTDKPYSIVIGESIGGTITIELRDLPHMLIAGTTGGGKSVFFKQALLGLLHTSPSLQMYLLDLKRGVEMKEFSVLPNVALAKNEKEAVFILRKLKIEMDRRFKYMEEHGYKQIEPERDKMDLIVVGVDEASVLYTKSGRRSLESELIEEARQLTDELAKLARAAAIHLILATQKVSKETIDTKIQENIGGRMCFRMNTLQGSLTVLGNKMAFELPDHKGRAIWASGNNFNEVQAPLVKEDEILRACEVICFEYENGKRKNFQAMLTSQNVPNQGGTSISDVGIKVD